MATARLESKDGLSAWCRCQVVDVAGDGQWCGHIGRKRLKNQCPGCAVLWLTKGVLKWPWNVGAVAWSCWNNCWVKLELACSWCWLLHCHLMVSARKVKRGDQKWSKKTLGGQLLEELFEDGKTFWEELLEWEKGSCNWSGRLSWICGCDWFDFTSSASVDYSGGWGKGRSGSSRNSSPAGLYWSSAHLVQCEPDELCRTWLQTWVQARMPDDPLNRTKRSSVIQCCQRYHRSLESGPAEAGSHSASNLSLTLNIAPGRRVNFWLLPLCLYCVSRCFSTGRGKYFCTLEVSL